MFQAGLNSVMFFAQCGHWIFCPTAAAGNSMWPPHEMQDILRNPPAL
jgi:hypothetical protein